MNVVDPSRTAVGGGGGRDRGGRAVVGTAVPRPVYANNPVQLIYYPWNSYYSRYGYYGYGYNYAFGYNRCGWGYGCPAWYSPYWYDPFYRYGYYGYGGRYGAYDPYDQYDQGYSSSSSSSNSFSEPEPRRMGSIRIKAKPATAKVYIDGTLVGTIDDFDGLTNHLELEAGPHEMEIRADGYVTLVKSISVKADQTMTERLSLKKK